ncbi:acyltransferase family protein [Burkholderia cenocepacia]|uniref:acyltransferase family protein n=1 Tax=Burkholderia cenocepacia TaxID=95486 RepID=UPI0029608F25|nr:acyltransferase [Burkholderia cenocepacia]HEF4739401.1 acyltransferase [Burkholderia multivorans]
MKEGMRYPALDAMRGIAALTVMISHILQNVRQSPYGWFVQDVIDRLPMGPVVWGTAPVMFFFVLSGFVLSVSPDAHVRERIPGFWAKRITRIWIPYFVALVAFAGLNSITSSFDGGQYALARNNFRAPFEWSDFLKNVALIFFDFPNHFLGVSWTLVHEMRISLLFPILLVILWDRSWFVTLFSALALFYGGHLMLDRANGSPYDLSMYNTIYISGMFVFGILAARYRAEIASAMAGWSRSVRIFAISIAVSLYLGGVWDLRFSLLPWYPIGVVFGCFALICLGFTSSGSNWIVHSRAAQWLGRVSYSLYLWHPAVLMVCFRCMSASNPLIVSIVGTVVAMAISELSFRFIEKPSMQLGQWVSKRIGTMRPNATA